MENALEGFLALDCDDEFASRLRTEAQIASEQGIGYDLFELDLFDVEMFYAEDRVVVREAAELGYADAELTVADFLSALPDVPAGPRMYGREKPRRVIVPPPPTD